MKKTYLLVFLSVVLISAIMIGGCENTSSPTGTRVIKGVLKDSVSSYPIPGALITTVPSSSNGVTDSLGNFIITGLEEGTYALTFKKAGYYSKTLSYNVSSDTVNIGSVRLYFINIWTFNGLTVTEYFNDNSYSAVDLYLGQVVQETNNANKDIQLRDSAGMSVNFIFRSADLATRFAGNQTKFSNPLINPRTQTEEFTKTDFDTLSKIPTISPVITEADFPNDRTLSFNAPLQGTDHKVYAFYLKGRGYIPPTYGMFYLNYGTRDTISPGQPYKFTIDVKINRNGLNEFNPNAYSK